VCVRASEKGFLTLLSIDSMGDRSLLYPNSGLSHDESAAPIDKNQRICIGDSKAFYIVALEPLGLSQIAAYWTPTEEKNRLQAIYPLIGKLAKGTDVVTVPRPNVYSTIEYMTVKP
jgi:hypothetical protein